MVQSLNKQPKLLDQVRYAIRTKHYSYRTEEAYVNWIIRFILYHNKRHPKEMGEKEINQFLTYPLQLKIKHYALLCFFTSMY
jgi:hypothetical protein